MYALRASLELKPCNVKINKDVLYDVIKDSNVALYLLI